MCFVCKGNVEACRLEHGNNTSIEIWVRCHGKEDCCRIEFPYRLRNDFLESDNANWSIKRAMADWVAFDNSHQENTARR